MTIHVNIGEAKTRLSQLIAAAKRGEKVIIARDGVPEAELTAVDPARDKAERRARLLAFMGSLRGQMPDVDFDSLPLFTDEEREKFKSPEF